MWRSPKKGLRKTSERVHGSRVSVRCQAGVALAAPPVARMPTRAATTTRMARMLTAAILGLSSDANAGIGCGRARSPCPRGARRARLGGARAPPRARRARDPRDRRRPRRRRLEDAARAAARRRARAGFARALPDRRAGDRLRGWQRRLDPLAGRLWTGG